jgi:hypothetical protein
MWCGMKKPTRKPKSQPLATGECWFVRLPQATQLACVFIEEMTQHTVVLRLEAELGQNYGGLLGRYERSAIKFVERLL